MKFAPIWNLKIMASWCYICTCFHKLNLLCFHNFYLSLDSLL
nr:MAG TPA: hypothetical protein [Bacteriophage sp.]